MRGSLVVVQVRLERKGYQEWDDKLGANGRTKSILMVG